MVTGQRQFEAPESVRSLAITPSTDEAPDGGGHVNGTSVHVGVVVPWQVEDAPGGSA